MTREAACHKILLLLTMNVYVVLTVCQLRMILKMIHMMNIPSPGILACCIAVLTLIVLIMQDLLLQCSPLPVIVEVSSPVLPYQSSDLFCRHKESGPM